MRAEQLTVAVAEHGEGPVWDWRNDLLLWVDLFRGDVLRTTTGGITDRWHIADVAACVGLRAGGGLVVATERGFALVDPQGLVDQLPDLWSDTDVRMNDGCVGPDGRFWCGSMAYDAAAGRGALYRLETDLRSVEAFRDVTISNGLDWSPDETRAFYVDSPTGKVDVCLPNVTHRLAFAEIDPALGVPDGLTVDAEGGVWVAIWGGGQVHRYAPDGTLDVVVELPVRQVTSCAFGGDDLSTLFITTSSEGLPYPEPEAGALFALQPGTVGKRAVEFAG